VSRPEVNRERNPRGQIGTEWRWDPRIGNYKVTIIRRGRDNQGGRK
jgi:hypothetical protein